MIKENLQLALYQILAKNWPQAAVGPLDIKLETPVEPKFGDFSTNIAMKLAPALKLKPQVIGQRLLAVKEQLPEVERAEVIGPGFVNFFLSQRALMDNLKQINKLGDEYGKIGLGQGRKVVIDYSAPNISKPMHIGHLRTTVIGQSLYNIYKFLGWKTIGDSHLGDWGTQFGKLLVLYKRKHGDKIVPITVDDLTSLYVEFHRLAETDKSLEEEARAETKKLQTGDKANQRLWRHFTRISLKDFQKVYSLLGVKIDYALGESFYQKDLSSVVKLCQKAGLAKTSQGAIIIEFDPKTKLPPFLIEKADGAHLYTTTDIATLLYRQKKWHPDLILYVVGNEQSLHFQQLFKVSEQLRIFPVQKLRHIKFGLILDITGKKFSTRKGGVVKLQDILCQAIEQARQVVERKNPDLTAAEKQQVAKTVGVSAVIYNDLSQHRTGDIRFDWQRMLSLEGNSAPYLLYTYARLRSITRKAGKVRPVEDLILTLPVEQLILRRLIHFTEAVEQAASECSPNYLAEYCYQLVALANNFYQQVPVIKAPEPKRGSRLLLISAVAQAVKTGLRLLNIKTLEKI